MRVKIILLLLLPLSCVAQIDGLKFQMGPKIDKFHSTSEAVEMLPHVDVSAGIFVYKEINEDWRIHLGVVKQDYSAKFQIPVNDVNTGNDEVFFKNYVFPTFTSYQLAIMPSYRYMINADLAVYGSAGLMLYLSKNLSRTGVEEKTEALVDEDLNELSSMTLTTFNNQFASGNYLIRGDIGLLYGIKEYLALDVSINGRFSSLEHGSFDLKYTDDSGINTGEDRIYNKGLGMGLNVGLQLKIN